MEKTNKLVGDYTNKNVLLKKGIRGIVRQLVKEDTDIYHFEYYDKDNKPISITISETDIVTNEDEFIRAKKIIDNINLILKICES